MPLHLREGNIVLYHTIGVYMNAVLSKDIEVQHGKYT